MKTAAPTIAFMACALCAAPAWTQSFPAKPVRIVVGFSAGSTTDLIGRVLATKMAEVMGQPVVVDNRPGAGANIAAEIVSQAGAYLKSETAKYAKVVKAIGLRIE